MSTTKDIKVETLLIFITTKLCDSTSKFLPLWILLNNQICECGSRLNIIELNHGVMLAMVSRVMSWCSIQVDHKPWHIVDETSGKTKWSM